MSTTTGVGAALAALVLLPALLIAATLTTITHPPGSSHTTSTPTSPGPGPAATAPGNAPSQGAVADIPADYLALYQQAAASCGMDWAVLAAVGKIESNHGRSTLPGVRSGSNPAGAQGPMQFLPATFAQYSYPVPSGGANPPSPYNPVNAIHAAARMLCRNGATHNRNLTAALYSYNHSRAYVNTVLQQANRYRAAAPSTTPPPASPSNPASSGAPSQTAAVAVAFARSQLGQPYRWGGDGPTEGGWDCSGLTRAAYAAAGITLPRTAQTQYNTGPQLPAGTTPQPGDLVFYGTSSQHITHVAVTISPTQMINAPYSGAVVRINQIQRRDLIGFSRPAPRDAS